MLNSRSRLLLSLLAACGLAFSLGADAASPGAPGSPGAPAIERDAKSSSADLHHGAVVVNGIKLHYVEGGEGGSGDPILLIPGWPESWYAWRFVMPRLIAEGHHVVALDLRGMGDSDHPPEGYDSKTISADIHAFVASKGLAKQGNLHVAGHDVGAWMAYAYAADCPREVRTLTVMEAALPGITPPPPAGIPGDEANLKSWHFAFNRLPDLPEILVQGHERAYLSWLFAQKSVKRDVFTPEALDEYTRVFAQPGGAQAAFNYYRAAFSDTGLQQNRLRAATPLAMPVLAIGGQHSVGAGMEKTMRLVATDVQGATLPGVGHFVLEESPADVAAQLTAFIRKAGKAR
jgi:pimeloyl-ACP methyl ester carboxylesterase